MVDDEALDADETRSAGARPASRRAPTRSQIKARRRVLVGGVVLVVALGIFLWLRGSDSQEAMQRGLAAHQEGDIDTAREEYQRVLEDDPGNVYANYNLGLVEHAEGNVDEAVRYYEAALEADPEFVRALFNLAIAVEAQGDNDRAASLYQNILQIRPNEATAHLNLGFLLHDKLGRQEEGRQHLRRAVELNRSLGSRVPDELLAAPAAPPQG